MKALLSQWIGGTKTNQQPGTPGNSVPVNSEIGSPVGKGQSFMGLMLKFLGMKGVSAAPAEGDQASSSHQNSKQTITDDKQKQDAIPATARLPHERKTLHKFTKTTEKGPAVVEEGQKKMPSASGESLNPESADGTGTASQAVSGETQASAGEGPLTTSTDSSTQPSKGTTPHKQAGDFNRQSIKAEHKISAAQGHTNSAGEPSKQSVPNAKNQPASSPMENNGRIKKDLDPPARFASEKTGSNSYASDYGKTQKKQGGNVNNLYGEASKKSTLKTGGAPRSGVLPKAEATANTGSENRVNVKQTPNGQVQLAAVGKKTDSTSTDFAKKLQRRQENGNRGLVENENATGKAKNNRPDILKTSTRMGNNTNNSFAKGFSGPSGSTPGKMTFSPSADPFELEMDMDGLQELKKSTDNTFKEIPMNELKRGHLSEAAGRKTFGKQLAQVSRQQFGQSRSASQQPSQWQHHRFILKDGNAIHVSARSADGALQLQLNAGNSELGKVLHQHLQDIQQHVQQELNIEIDLQLRDFGGREPGQQQESSSSGPKQSGNPSLSNSQASDVDAKRSANIHRQVRYFGFNNNEWTA